MSAKHAIEADGPVDTGAEPEVIGPFLARAMRDSRWADCSSALIPGGMSNLTYVVRSPAGEVIVRRPPLGHILATAHDMVREFRVMTALAGTAVPVPRTMIASEAGEALEFPCLVMERVLGHVCRHGFPDGYADEEADRRRIGEAVVDILADLHRVDPAAVGLEAFGRPEGFMERQLRRWSKQWDATKVDVSPTAELEALRDGLVATLPSREHLPAVVHGDFRLDNTVLHPVEPGRIVAVLDWEMSTLGDPLADLGSLLAYWAQADDDDMLVAGRVIPPVTAMRGFPTRDEVVERYARRTGFDVSRLDWYVAFAYFKLAVICQGIAARHAGGAMVGDGFDEALGNVAPLVAAGRRVLAGLGAQA
jgi:aminoglycoside phosphotransferase (APT) family kinase protein